MQAGIKEELDLLKNLMRLPAVAALSSSFPHPVFTVGFILRKCIHCCEKTKERVIHEYISRYRQEKMSPQHYGCHQAYCSNLLCNPKLWKSLLG